MITLEGFWYDGDNSGRTDVRLWLDDTGDIKVYSASDKQLVLAEQFSNVSISSRLGNTPRFIRFTGGQKFETQNNDAVDEALAQFSVGYFQQWIHRLESHLHFVLLTLVLVIAFGWGMVTYGVPSTAKVVAHLLPHEVLKFASEQALYSLDKSVFDETQLTSQVQQRVSNHFSAAIEQHPELKLKVAFRDGGPIGANAFALPDGTIVFTDQMVQLALDDDELLAVFAHEIGHVAHRHGMRSVVQDSLLGFLLLMMTGDTAATAEVFLALPIIVTELAYSRGFERESDDYALNYLQANNIATHHFASLMGRLEKQAQCHRKVLAELRGRDDINASESVDDPSDGAQKPSDEQQQRELELALQQRCSAAALDRLRSDDSGQASEDGAAGFDFSNYLSTHPSTVERLRRFK